ncbi:mediator of RNA polymerase II transcription subunit 22 isoform X8 [Marmota marmota marmota]|uniref:mediator of RNA polymerase II transcription subunit 22 isoform X8 n=2 Tax=Marmota TaxID=9992 RepID=UPI002091E98A|nr:mediator of RNA polymerase II transcription subunit 22 isoform X8 [Marmota marmota marmota]
MAAAAAAARWLGLRAVCVGPGRTGAEGRAGWARSLAVPSVLFPQAPARAAWTRVAVASRAGPATRPRPTMAQQRALPQSKETLLQSYNKRLKDDVKSIMDNFTEIIKTAKVRAGESLMKLVSDLKQFLILNDFPSVNEAIDQRNQQLRALQEECDRKLITLRDEVSIDLYELEEEYYSSSSSLCEANDLPLCEAYWRLDLDTDSADGLSAPLLASPEPGVGPLQAAAPAHSHTGGSGPTEHA